MARRGGSRTDTPHALINPQRPFFPERLIWWLSLQLSLGLLPLFFAALGNGRSGWHAAIDEGEMFLIAVVIVGGNVGDVVRLEPTSPWRRTWRALIVGGGVLFCIIGAFLYARYEYIAHTGREQTENYSTQAQFYSYMFLLLAMVIGVGQNYLAHVEDVRRF